MTSSTKAVTRYGTRYGITTRQRLAEVEATQKKKYECPSCKQKKVKRVCKGIWQCRKCGTKFAGRAYAVSKKIKIKDELVNVREIKGKKHKEEPEEEEE
ncbi:MAG: 50S ribosomal protein L37ae [Nanoarchaeota archaeon]|nr:50S ribosomal protein L37ae [Nanoarchaeota archaeon]